MTSTVPPRRASLACVLLALALAIPVTIGTGTAHAVPSQDPSAEPPKTATIFVVDPSGSMNEPTPSGRSKLDIAKEAFLRALGPIGAQTPVALRVYGDQFPARGPSERGSNCENDTRLVVPLAEDSADALASAVPELSALGDTPIALALRAVVDDVPEGYLARVVLFSDGRDECWDADLDGDPATGPSYGEEPCAVARDLAAMGADVRLEKIQTVGFGADDAAAGELQCIADAGGGTFTNIEDTSDIDQLVNVLEANAARSAERLEPSTPIAGGTDMASAPDLRKMDADEARLVYTDRIRLGEERWYRMPEYGPGAGDSAATVFDLPEVEGIELGLRLEPGPDANVRGDIGDTNGNAGVPRAPSASVRCGGCRIQSGDSFEMFVVVSLSADDAAAAGTYDLELLLEGEAWGGTSDTCPEDSTCWYEARIASAEQTRAAKEAEAETCCDLVDLQPDIDQAGADLEDELALLDTLEAQSASTTNLLPVVLAALAAAAAGAFAFVRRRGDTAPATAGPSGAIATPDGAVIGTIEVADDDPAAGEAVSPPVPPVPPVTGETPTDLPDPVDDGPAGSTVLPDEGALEVPERGADDPLEVPETAATEGAVEGTDEPATDDPLEVPETAATEGAVERTDDPAADAPPAVGGGAPGTDQPAGWYTDPKDATSYRWWDGSAWTDHIQSKEGS